MMWRRTKDSSAQSSSHCSFICLSKVKDRTSVSIETGEVVMVVMVVEVEVVVVVL